MQKYRTMPHMMGFLYLPFGFIGFSLANLNVHGQATLWTILGSIPAVLLLMGARALRKQKKWGVWLTRLGFVIPTAVFLWILQIILVYRSEHSEIVHSVAPYLLLIIFLPAPIWLAYSFLTQSRETSGEAEAGGNHEIAQLQN